MRVQRTAEMVQLGLDRADVVVCPDHGTGNQVAVSVQILGAAVQNQVEAHLDRAEVDRRGEGVVDHRDEPVGPGEVHDGAVIGDLQQRVVSDST